MTATAPHPAPEAEVPEQVPAEDPRTLTILRWILLGVFVFAVTGTLIELYLLGHFEGVTQWVPVVLLAGSLLVAAWYGLSRSRQSVATFRVISVLLILGGIAGLYFHHQGNRLFELEVTPELHGFELFWLAVTGVTPALAPGAMIQFGLLGLAFTFRHPLLRRSGK